jgi:hypothetical protein
VDPLLEVLSLGGVADRGDRPGLSPDAERREADVHRELMSTGNSSPLFFSAQSESPVPIGRTRGASP